MMKKSKRLPYYEDFYKQVIDIVNPLFDKSVTWLDIGCGTGKMAEIALRMVDIDKFVFCDSSVNMIEIAKQRFESENTEFTTSSILELHNNIQFDVITAIQVFYYFDREKRIEAIAECEEHIGRYGKEYFPISISEHLGVLEQCGFKNAEIIWVSNMQVGLLGVK